MSDDLWPKAMIERGMRRPAKCVHLGETVRDGDGRARTRECAVG